jgi:hypothetical protein
VVAAGVFGGALDRRLDELAVPPDLRRRMETEAPKLARAEVPPDAGELRRPLEQALADSFVLSFRVVMLVAAGLALAAAQCARLTVDRPRQ